MLSRVICTAALWGAFLCAECFWELSFREMSSGRCRSCAKISPKQINTTLKKDKAYRPPANTPAAASLRQLQTASSFTRTHHSIFASPLSSLTHSQSTELTPESRTDPCWKRFTIQFFVLLCKAIKLHTDNKVRQHKHMGICLSHGSVKLL